jgi:predicted nucleotidyltransferase
MESTDAASSTGRSLSPLFDGRHRELDLHPIATLLDRIHARWHPEQIWLFGSRARGDARPSSDWDLFVVLPDDAPEEELAPEVGWRLQKASGITADVIACYASDFHEDRSTPNTLAFDAAREGVLLYER